MSEYPLLPPTYYRDHFCEMLGSVVSIYGETLGDEDKQFISDFKDLDVDCQCLFIRMINRKKVAFSKDHLNYAEIRNLQNSLNRLSKKNFTRNLIETDYRPFLTNLSKKELLSVCAKHALKNVRAAWPKARIVQEILENVSWENFSATIDPTPYFVPLRNTQVAFFHFLYLGKLTNSAISFTLRDLGIVSTKSQESYKARFRDIDEAKICFFYHQKLHELKTSNPEQILDLTNRLDEFPAADTDYAADLRNRTLFRIGRCLEAYKELDMAIKVYEASSAFESRERLIRLHYAKGNIDTVKAKLELMIDNPANDDELIFSQDFYKRKFLKERRSVFTDLLQNSYSIEVDDLYRGFPELAAIKHFEKDGWTGRHVENSIWPTLFGLLFWEELFEDPDAYSCEFDYVPKALKQKNFHIRHGNALRFKLDLVRKRKALPLIHKVLETYHGAENALVTWSDDLVCVTSNLLEAANPSAVAEILELMATDFYSLTDGFPDLMLVRNSEIRFIEVKGEGDQIRRNQLSRINLLNRLGLKTDIVRINYRIDPDQSYVVVDVETTGSRPPYDRVTEIGAVKIRDGKIVSEWHSLIKPQKHIPAFITKLTGISNHMVANAPLFSQVADDFADFIAGSVFIAHNVNFDYSFIASEYRRLEKTFVIRSFAQFNQCDGTILDMDPTASLISARFLTSNSNVIIERFPTLGRLLSFYVW